jgi:ABC-2 type transport system permease protein
MSQRPSSPFMALLALNLKSVFAIHLPGKKDLASSRVLLKTFGWIVLAIFLVADFGFMFAMMDIGMYNALAPLGMQSLMLLYAIVTASVLVFLFAFITSLSLFSSAQYESLFLTMPLRPSSLLIGRMATVYAIETPIVLLVMGMAAGVYGIKGHPGFDFYLYMLFNALAMPLVPLAVSYAVLVPVMSTSRWLRRKNTILYIGGFIGLALALGFNFYLQRMMSRINDPVLLQKMLSQGQLNFADIADWWPPAWLTMQAIAKGSSAVSAIAATLANLALGAAQAVAIAFLFGGSYVKILASFGETHAVKGRLSRSQAGSLFRARPVLLSLVQRELRLMNREPSYFLNGPFVILLLPVIFALTFVAQGDEMRNAVTQLRPYLAGPAEYLIPAGLGIFFATATSIACTAFSRDAKSLPLLKSLPLQPRDIIAAKLVHALIFAALGIALGTVGGSIMLRVDTLDAIVALLLSISGALALTMAGLAIDTFWPRLSWENPIAALKRNPNTVIALLGSMGLIVGLGILAVTLPSAKYTFAILYGMVFVAACVAFGLLLSRAGPKRLRQMEP